MTACLAIAVRGGLHRGVAAVMILALCSVLSPGCSSDDGGGDDGGGTGPDPVTGSLAPRFLVYQLEINEKAKQLSETLIWKGTPAGPDADSPNPTTRPQILSVEPFRIDWELIDAGNRTVEGFQYEANPGSAFRLPRDEADQAVWGDDQSFIYWNQMPADDDSITFNQCLTGPQCPDRQRWPAGTYTLKVFARDTKANETELADATLQFTVTNEEPQTGLVIDSPGICDDPTLYPHYRIPDEPGGEICTFATFDTVPAGATVYFKLTGTDPVAKRLAAAAPPELRAQLQEPRVRFQGRYNAFAQVDENRQLNTLYSTAREDDVVNFEVGPFHYVFSGRAIDRLDVEDSSPIQFEFYAGYAPRTVSIEPDAGDEILLRDPDEDGFWPQNTVSYTLEEELTLYWDQNRYTVLPGDGRVPVSGDFFEIPLRFVGAGDIREDGASNSYSGAVRAWAYEFFGDADPLNLLPDGPGADDLNFFADSSQPDNWDLTGTEAVRIFVPQLFWSFPDLYDPDTCPSDDFCGQGELLLRQLGQITLIVRGRTTGESSVLPWYPQTMQVAGEFPELLDVSRLGLISESLSESFSMRLGIADPQSGDLAEIWPAPLPSKRVERR